MARLTIEQIRAPDLSVASQATARAGKSFQEGMSNAQDLLSQYQEGLEAQGDAELTNLLAGAKNEDEWNAIVASTDFSKMNLSKGMRDNIVNRRGAILGYEQDRSTRRGTDATTANTQARTARTTNQIGIDNDVNSRANDLHGVSMGDHAWRQNARQEDADLAGAALRAAQEGSTNGNPDPVTGLIPENVGPRIDGTGIPIPEDQTSNTGYRASLIGTESGGNFRAQNNEVGSGGKKGHFGRVQFGHARFQEAKNAGAVPKGMTAEQFKNSPEAQRSAENWHFDDLEQELGHLVGSEVNGQVLDLGSLVAMGHLGGAGGAKKYVATNGGYNPSDSFGTSLSDYATKHAGKGGSAAPRKRVTQNPNQAGPQQQAYLDALAGSKYQSTDRVLSKYDEQYEYNVKGEKAIAAADAKAAEEAVAQQILDAADNNVDPTEAIVEAKKSGKGATAIEELERRAKIIEQSGEGGALSAARLQIGTTGASPQDVGIADATLSNIKERQNRDPFQFAHNAAATFVENPAESMTSALKGLGVSTTPSDVESAINKLATEMGITRAEAAYSYARAAENETRLGRTLSIGGDNLSNWGAEDFARKHFVGDNAEKARAALGDDKIVVGRIKQATRNLGNIERKIQKIRQSGGSVSPDLIRKREAARDALGDLYKRHSNKKQDSPDKVANPLAGGYG